ncbi:MAG: hypothetical protein JOZ83_15035 [Silvibacterium sp.]|nr:hypothetical protein [Silvibacterium sp.]
MAALTIAAVVPALALAQSDPGASEQIETGRVRISGGAEVVYRIRMLPPASFPALPPAVTEQLEQRKCMVPQTYEARAPENVIHAALERRGSSDWAVLCSVNAATTLYVFFQSQPGSPIALRKQRDSEWIGSEVLGAYGSAWGISRRSPSQIRQARGSATSRVDADHDGIEDAFIERSSTTHYFQDGSWITLENP